MEDYDGLPEVLKKASHSLHPFIKQRQEATQIRRILSSHLSVHLNADGGLPISRPLSLVDPTSSIDAIPHGVRGIQKEYLRCVRANIKARKEYSKARQDHYVGLAEQGAGGGVRDLLISQDGSGDSVELFLDLVRQRQKYERLRIIQDYMDTLGQKPAANVEHLEPEEVLKDVETLPKVPLEVVNTSSPNQASEGRDLKELVGQLEKSVFRAKMLLKREQRLLAKVQAENATSSAIHGGRLQAVEVTRHELINWIEGELAKAGDNPSESEECQSLTKSDNKGKEYIDAELTSIQGQYARYTMARQALIIASTGNLDPPASAELDPDNDLQPTKEESQNINGMSHGIYSYLEAMVSVSNEQKAMIQQKSHLTIGLAKQLKESSQGLDRLADESHLLPAHPLPAASSQRKASEGTISFGEQMSNHEKPDTSRRARAWMFASESATNATKCAISEKLEEGAMSLEEARKTLLDLQALLGDDNGSEDLSANRGSIRKRDIWTTLDGNLGVIKGDTVEL